MRHSKANSLILRLTSGFARAARQHAIALFLVLVAACSGDNGPREASEPLKGFIGAVVADEPQAALIGRDMLAIGGSAVDAAVAVAFALGVTLPSQTGLGGGGVCVAFDQKTGDVRALDFLAEAPASVGAPTDKPAAVPAMVRGLYTLHARYGRLPWSQLVAPAERLARFGTPVSRAFARDLEALRSTSLGKSGLRRLFGTADGSRLLGEGDPLVQLELAATLSRLRSEGPAGLYIGPGAAAFATAAQAAGYALTQADLANYRPLWRDTLRFKIGNETVHVPPPPVLGGLIAAEMVAILSDGDRFRKAGADERDHLLAEAGARAYADADRARTSAADPNSLLTRAHSTASMAGYRRDQRSASVFANVPTMVPLNAAATGIVAVDRDGNGVTCALTLNSLFGSGRIATGTGVVLASVPSGEGRGGTALGPMLVINEAVSSFRFAAAASGGVAAPSAVAATAARVILADTPASAAVNMPRVFAGSEPDRVLIERTLPPDRVEALRRRGHSLTETPPLGHVNAIACPQGLPRYPESCAAATDQRGFGFAILGG